MIASNHGKALDQSTDVSDLKDALGPEYDDFFAAGPKVSYSACEDGHITSSEGPQFHDHSNDFRPVEEKNEGPQSENEDDTNEKSGGMENARIL